MSAAKSVLLVLCFSICATAQTRTLVVYPGPADGLSSVSSHHLEVELKRILSSAGIVPAWRNSGERTGKRLEAGPLVVASFKGACGVESLPAYAAPAQTRALADTSVSGDRILPYLAVDCGRLIRTLSPTLQRLNVPFRESILGRALARVIAHEIYHILAQTRDHERAGLAKKELSLNDLTASRFDLSPDSVRRMVSFWSVSPEPPAVNLAALARAKR